MAEDYIEDEFLEEEESASNRRPFLVAVGVLVSLFILMGACTAFFLVSNRAAQDQDSERFAIETRNAETLASNAATAIAATEVAAASPTDTPEPTAAPTETSAPNTPEPTNTPVVDEGDEDEGLVDEGDGDSEDAEGDNASDDDSTDSEGSTDADDGNTDDAENGDDSDTAVDGAAPTPITGVGEKTDGDALPETGLDTWWVVIAGIGLVGLFIFARRLRTTG